MRIKFIKVWKHHPKGEVLVIDPKNGMSLINKGIAILTKDITSDDLNKQEKHGITSKLRTN